LSLDGLGFDASLFDNNICLELNMCFQFNREQWLSDCWEMARYQDLMEYEAQEVLNGADPLDFHRHC